MINNITRRDVLGVAAMTAAGGIVSGCSQHQKMAREPGNMQIALDTWSAPKTRIRKIYLAKPVPTWPKPDLDIQAEIQRIENLLARLSKQMPGVELTGGELFRALDGSDVPKSAGALGNPDGILVFNLTSTMRCALGRVADLGKPTILFAQPYSGHDWLTVATLRDKGHRIACLATSDYGEIVRGCQLMRELHLLGKTRIAYVNTGPCRKHWTDKAKKQFGLDVVHIGPDRLNAAYASIDQAPAEAEADLWIKNARKVVEPSRQEIVDSGRLYLALRKIMAEEKAHAVTINCLGMFKADKLSAYPCLAFSRLNNLGLTGVCEADVDSTLTQLMFTYAFGVPGFVSDPVVDTSTDTVIHAHCVASTHMDGPTGPQASYLIRSHLEDDKGASLQVKMRVGQTITAAKLIDADTMLISTGTIIGNPDVDRGCRTKVATRVNNARHILDHYTGGLHRVIFYGDRVEDIRLLSQLANFKVIEEC